MTVFYVSDRNSDFAEMIEATGTAADVLHACECDIARYVRLSEQPIEVRPWLVVWDGWADFAVGTEKLFANRGCAWN